MLRVRLPSTRNHLLRAAGLIVGVVVSGTLGYSLFGLDPIDAFYQTIITISTVGFRELVAGEPGNAWKIFTSVLILVGTGYSYLQEYLPHVAQHYLREGAVLGKTFPNCFLNMSWIHIISPQGARHDLKEWLRMVPSNKIMAFGDDVMHVEVVYGHLKMARQNFAIVLAELIEEGLLSETTSLEVAQAAFHDTPAAVYGVRP